MTWDEFYAHVTMQFSTINEWRGNNCIYWNHGDSEKYSVSWVTGGMGGGNCWGDSANYEVEAEPEPDLRDIDQLLETVCENLTLVKYRKVMAAVVKWDSHTDSEYYGNYTTYGSITVNYRDLYDQLVENRAWPC